MHVGIIGAGIGGTCLAHGLKKNGIKVTLFERNGPADNQLPGYGIHINVFGQQALKQCLSEENWAKLTGTAKNAGGKIRFYDERLHLLAEHGGSNSMNDQIVPESRLSISRVQLQEILLSDLQEDIHWHKEYKSYQVLSDERIRLNFTDESDVTVDLLVGADASNSKVRKQYLPQYERTTLGVTAIAGRTRLTEQLKAKLPAELYDGSPNSIVPATADWMFMSVWHAPVHTDRALPTEFDDYLVWAYVIATNELPQEILDGGADSLGDFVTHQTLDWDERFHHLVMESDVSSVSAIELKSMEKLGDWKSSAVTLLGDAIHNMTPMAGVGANTALRDALEITHQLTEAVNNNTSIITAVSRYEQKMRGYANTSVMLSRKNAENAVDPSFWKRRIFRWLLKFAGRFTFVNKLMFPHGH
jgi:2-polyprenyl-6-methoxyphenol hydroxylase-like FAD-dependent oxidoreductase